LKGIYPRDPPKVSSGRAHTYYHHKDIKFLLHEPLLEKFRSISAYMKKVNKVAHKGQVDLARRMYARRPIYTLDHLVRERYPHFGDAVADLDDALCTLHLYATLPGDKRYVEPAASLAAAALTKQWQFWVASTRALRKVFLSIKGIYYQAEVDGQDVTWLAPYKFVQSLPEDVDFSVMTTFHEFYENMLKFTMFKLYHDGGMAYPPHIKQADEEGGAHLGSLKAIALGSAVASTTQGATVQPATPAAQLDAALARAASAASAAGAEGEGSDDGTADSHGDEAGGPTVASGGDDEDVTLIETFGAEGGEEGGDDAAKAIVAARERKAAQKKFQRLFEGKVFFLGRETPLEPLEFVIASFGGTVAWEGDSSPMQRGDERITHEIIDRPKKPAGASLTREYVQPQWVFDSVNSRICLPTARYEPGSSLPPHLSPFVDDAREGYIPAYRQELDTLVAATEGRVVLAAASAAGGAAPSVALVPGDEEAQHAAELAAEAAGKTYAQAQADGGDSSGDDDDSDDSEEEEEDASPAAGASSTVRKGLGKLGKAPNQFADRNKFRGGVAGMLGNTQAPSYATGASASLPVGADGLVQEDEGISERRELAAAMLSRKKRRQYDVVQKSLRRSENHRMRLAAKRQRVDEEGEETLMGFGEEAAPKSAAKTAKRSASNKDVAVARKTRSKK
jgi:pescadillo protein